VKFAYILASIIIAGSVSTSYVLADTFTSLNVTPGSTQLTAPVGVGKIPVPGIGMDVNGVLRLNNDMFLDRTTAFNSIVQSQAAFNAGKDVIYQKAGGGDMSGYQVKADKIILSGGNVGIGQPNPIAPLDVLGNIRLTGNIVSPNDICIGTCP